jgi:hypothetical protein
VSDILYDALGILLLAGWVLSLALSARGCPGREYMHRKPKEITGVAYWLWEKRR